jgi:hypothetical protein
VARSPGDDPPDETPPAGLPDEPRARDVAAAKSTAELEDKLDPSTVAQLAAWFGLPSYQELEEERAAAAQPPPESELAAERREVNEKVDEVVDRQLLARIEGWRTAGDDMFDELVPPELHLVDDLMLSDPRFADTLGATGEPREVPLPPWLEDDLRDVTPQAMLRDLYRPEPQFDKYMTLGEPEPGFAAVLTDIRAIVLTDFTVRPEPSARVLFTEALAELRHWKAANWGALDLPKRDAPADEAKAEPGLESES